jgi:hypothetical protein
VLFEVPSYKISGIVDFIIDTGSTFSALTEREATIIGIDCQGLPSSKTESIGFGGTFNTKMINQLVTLTFRSGTDKLKLNFSAGFQVICIPISLEKDQREKLLRYTPSVLGMDILLKFETLINQRKVELTYLGQ